MVRPREFREEDAIAQVIGAFWDRGYERTSLDELVEATGLNRSSLYNAFGGKLQLFCVALDHYRAGPAREVVGPLLEERGGQALARFLSRLCEFIESADAHRGCLMVNTLAEGELDPAVTARVEAHFESIRRGIERAYREAVRDGELKAQGSAGAVAEWLLVFVRGVLLGAAGGEDVATLKRSVRLTGRQLGLRGVAAS